MSPDMAKSKRSSFSNDLITETIELDMSPLSIMARGAEPPEFMLPPAVHEPRMLKFGSASMPVLVVFFTLLTISAIDTLWTAVHALSFALPISIVCDVPTLLSVAVAGFLAQLVDGALGMGYGLTSSSVLVALGGVSPKTASAVVHLAQLGTTLLSGLAHNRQGTVDWPTAIRVAIPGVGGALIGAVLLSNLDVATAKHVASALLFAVGAYLFQRFLRQRPKHEQGRGSPPPTTATTAAATPPTVTKLAPIGAVGGFVDVAGGGGWGPVCTSGLLAEGRLPPSKVKTASSHTIFLFALLTSPLPATHCR